jgi:hypothetical protein
MVEGENEDNVAEHDQDFIVTFASDRGFAGL